MSAKDTFNGFEPHQPPIPRVKSTRIMDVKRIWKRQIVLTMQVVALGNNALGLADTPLGARLQLQGFIAPARKGSTRLVLHVQQYQRHFPGQGSVTV